MRLSVIVPTLNEADAITPLLGDLAPLRAVGHEVILADGGSRDTTITLAAPLVDQLVSTPQGRAVQMNAGAKASTGDCLWFLHADTRVPADAVSAIAKAHREGRRWGRFDVTLSGKAWPFRVIETMMNLRSRVTGIATGDQGIFVDREWFEAVGGYPAIALMEDIALSRELRRRGRPACPRTPRLTTSTRRWERRGILRTVLMMWRLRLAYALGADPAVLARHYR